jgi:hypothetical protein
VGGELRKKWSQLGERKSVVEAVVNIRVKFVKKKG